MGATAQTVLANRYELLAPIGSGGTGKVWRARDRKFDRLVAVKILTPMASETLDVDRLVEREGKLLAKLDHPGAVRVQDAGRDGEHRFLVMDLVDGVGLETIVDTLAARRERVAALTGSDLLALCGDAPTASDGVVRADQRWHVVAVRLVVALLRTLEAAHGVGVVHRDIKPGNICVVAGARPVLLDWGHSLLCEAAPGTLTAHLFGTVAYSAPEQWDGADKVGPRTDVYQLGVVLYELLTLRRCFPDDSTAETIRRVRSGDFRRPRAVDSSLPASLEACVLRAMELDVARRYQSVAIFRADLERWLAGDLPDSARVLSRASSAVRNFVRRRRAPLALGVACLLGAGSVLLWSAPAIGFERTGNVLHVRADEPVMMLAFRVQEQDGGVFWTPVKLRVGTPAVAGPAGESAARARTSVASELPAGTSEVTVVDIADPPESGRSFVQAVFASLADADAVRAVTSLAEQLQRAGRVVEGRHGVWLPEAELDACRQPGRGSAPIDLPIAATLAAGRWQQGGAQGIVIAW